VNANQQNMILIKHGDLFFWCAVINPKNITSRQVF